MKRALPTNSIRFISGEVRGINRFIARPARKAPMIGSIPAVSARKAPRKTTTSTKMYCETLSWNRLKNHRPSNGKRMSTIAPKRVSERPRRIQNPLSTDPAERPTMMVSTRRARVSVIIVPPTVMVTAWFFVMPSLLTIG